MERQEKSLYVVSSETKVGFTLMKQEKSAILQRTFREKKIFKIKKNAMIQIKTEGL